MLQFSFQIYLACFYKALVEKPILKTSFRLGLLNHIYRIYVVNFEVIIR